MGLKNRLQENSRRVGKLSYDELVEKLEEASKEGKTEYYIDYDDVYSEDIYLLGREEGIHANLLEGDGYSDNGCWEIIW